MKTTKKTFQTDLRKKMNEKSAKVKQLIKTIKMTWTDKQLNDAECVLRLPLTHCLTQYETTSN